MLSVEKFSSPPSRQVTPQGAQPNRTRSNQLGRKIDRIHYTPGRLRHIRCRPAPTGRPRRFLLDTGAGVNIIKERDAPQKLPLDEPRTIQLGNDRHTIHYFTYLPYLGVKHEFLIVPDDFPLIEDGIFGLPFLEKYQYQYITNNELKLNDTVLELQITPEDIEVKPGQLINHVKIIDNQPYLVNFVNTGKQPLSTSDQIERIKSNLSRIPELLSKLRTDHIEESFREPIKKIIASYNDVFTLETDPLPCTQLTTHEITLRNPKPINIKSYKPPECHKLEIQRQMKEMLDKGIIEPSDSAFNSPIWVVPKKTDASGKRKWRIVIDFRKLNEQTEQDAYPLPNADEIIQHLGNAKFFSALDLSAGFHQIPMDPNSKKYTAFSTSEGHFHYNRMSFGLKNSPATF